MKATNIIGIDPGLAHCGWGVLSQKNLNPTGQGRSPLHLLDCGEIITPSNLPLAERLGKIYEELQVVFSRYSLTACAVEELHFKKNRSSALPVAHARGVILLCAAQHNVRVSEFSANRIKQAVTGNGKALKAQVQQMVTFLLGAHNVGQSNSAGRIKNSDHVADSLAAAICLINHYPSLQQI